LNNQLAIILPLPWAITKFDKRSNTIFNYSLELKLMKILLADIKLNYNFV